MTIFYFSATGNSLFIAKSIADAGQGRAYSIPQLLKTGALTWQDDTIGFVVPVYGLGVPNVVKTFLQQATIKSSYAFALLTYGNMALGSCKWFAKLAVKNNIFIDYAAGIKMVDNYLPLFDMAAERQVNKQIPQQLAAIQAAVLSKKKHVEQGPAFVTAMVQSMLKNTFSTLCKNFRIAPSCNACGVCVTLCPKGNITLGATPSFGNSCEGCLGCVNLCPQGAIQIKGERNAGARFKNENVTLKEMIESNNQSSQSPPTDR